MLNLYEELAETSRRQILMALQEGKKNVSELIQITQLKQPNVSNHLSRLKAKEIVKAEKTGRQVFYSLGSKEVQRIIDSLLQPTSDQNESLDLGSLAQDYARAAVSGNEDECSKIFERSFRTQTSLIDLYEELLAPAMGYVGSWYEEGHISESQERMATETTRKLMSWSMVVIGTVPRHGKTAVIGCGPDNHHSIGISMVADYIRINGWKVMFLGPNNPVKSFVGVVESAKPNLVLTSCSVEDGLPGTLEIISKLDKLRDKQEPFLIGVGGSYVKHSAEKFLAKGADFTSHTLRSFATDYLPYIERYGRISP